jgi:hypothetical protein
LVGCLGSEPRLAQSQRRLFVRRLGEAAKPREESAGRAPDFASYTLAFALQLRQITENLSQGSGTTRLPLDGFSWNLLSCVFFENPSRKSMFH